VREEQPVAGQSVGYVRVSSTDQSTDRQLAGIDVDVMFEDKASGKDTNRPKLQDMLRHVRSGDTLFVHSLDRLGRDLVDLHTLIRELTGRGVEVRFVTEGLAFNGNNDAMAELMLALLAGVAQFERTKIRERQAEGIAEAKRRGVYKGRKPSLSPDQVVDLRAKARAGVAKAELARQFNISRETVYQYLRDDR
jgi:DNA invertase Pin-like site-specific DNA recombinase